jgi:hypothetical protein
MRASAQVQAIENAVNISGATTFASHNAPVPDWWPEATKDMTHNVIPILQNEVRIALEQHDIEIEKREKSPRNRLIRIATGLLWVLAGVLLGWIVGLFH